MATKLWRSKSPTKVAKPPKVMKLPNFHSSLNGMDDPLLMLVGDNTVIYWAN